MFEMFVEKSMKVIMLAQEEARRLGHNFVGTEQILLGLLGEGTGVAAKTLKSFGVNLRDARAAVEKIIGRGSGFVAVEIPFTPRAKRVLELSWDEARQLGHNYIGTEHLLLGLIREGEGVAARALENLGVNLTLVRAHVIRLLGELRYEEVDPITASASHERYINEFGTNLRRLAKSGKLDSVVGRESEIEQVLGILTQNYHASALLVGEQGVGKSAIIRGIAICLADEDVPQSLQNAFIVPLNMQKILAFSDPCKIINECFEKAQEYKIILALEDLHLFLVPEIGSSLAINFVNTIHSFLKNNKLQCIASMDLSYAPQCYAAQPEFLRNFQPVMVLESNLDETTEILVALKSKFEVHHKLSISEEAINRAASLASNATEKGRLPAKAIMLIDEACSTVRLRNEKKEAMIRVVEEIRSDATECLAQSDHSKAEALGQLAANLCAEHHVEPLSEDMKIVKAADVQEVVSIWSQLQG